VSLLEGFAIIFVQIIMTNDMGLGEMAVVNPTIKLIRIRAYCGGFDGYQTSNFTAVLSDFLKRFQQKFQHRNWDAQLEVKYAADMKLCGWTPKSLVDWLEEGDFHIITSHVHQGVPRWNAADVVFELQRLFMHPGFPNGPNLQCPIFLQHKFHYLLGLRQYVNPTLAVQLPTLESSVDQHGTVTYVSATRANDFNLPEINSFLDQHNEGLGWVVKLPFVTMREGMIYAKQRSNVYKALEIMAAKFGNRIPYAMIQPRLLNRKEYKVIVLNGRVSHVLPQGANGTRTADGRTFSTPPHRDLHKFAETVVSMLHHVCPGTITNYLVRVDIMQKQSGNLIVNELESFEAAYASKCDAETSATDAFVKNFWENVLCKIGKELI
jgi:hypothetical protein